MINFEAKTFKKGPWNLLLIPKDASMKLPSRGMVMIDGTINGHPFQSALEPDGKGSHLLLVDKAISKNTTINAGQVLKLSIEPSKKWPEPKLPKDIEMALGSDSKAKKLWTDLTSQARWDWIRWIGSTKYPKTRKKHIVVALSKLKKGNRRPCCFNRTQCTLFYL